MWLVNVLILVLSGINCLLASKLRQASVPSENIGLNVLKLGGTEMNLEIAELFI